MNETGQTNVVEEKLKLLAVIVLYKLKPAESATLNTLQASIARLEPGRADVIILLYDNTPGGQDPGVLPATVQYRADTENGGLARAYNYALGVADEEGSSWLLTLDQDTSLPLNFVDNVCHAAEFVTPTDSIAAIVPLISDHGRVLSPKMFLSRWALMRLLPANFIGIAPGEISAINSAATIRVSALKAIGGYDPRFYLHASDVVLFHRLNRKGFRIFVAGNIHVEHEMSVFDLKKRSSPRRFEENVRSEEAFYDEYLGRIGQIVLLLRIFQRLTHRLWRTGGSLPYFQITLRSLCRRLFYSRRARLESWHQWVIREGRNL